MSKMSCSMIRIDPYQRKAALLVMQGQTFHREIAKNIKASQLGHTKLVDLEDHRLMGTRKEGFETKTFDAGPTPLHAIADANSEKGLPGWKLKGSDVETVGLSMIIATGVNGGMTDMPVGLEWLADNIEWLTPEEADGEGEES